PCGGGTARRPAGPPGVALRDLVRPARVQLRRPAAGLRTPVRQRRAAADRPVRPHLLDRPVRRRRRLCRQRPAAGTVAVQPAPPAQGRRRDPRGRRLLFDLPDRTAAPRAAGQAWTVLPLAAPGPRLLVAGAPVLAVGRPERAGTAPHGQGRGRLHGPAA